MMQKLTDRSGALPREKFRRHHFPRRFTFASAILIGMLAMQPGSTVHAQSNWTLLGWNNLGMHCMDSDYSVFSILPPYNTIHAQLIDGSGKLVTNSAGIGITYHAIADLDGSYNASSAGKGNFWNYSAALFGIALPAETGLPVPGPDSFHMPGTSNVPQAMVFEPAMKWFAAYGVPITPYDDRGKPNQYPMMRLMATNSSGQVLAMTDIVLPVSDEMDCKSCHASGAGPAAEPAAGWLWDPHPGRDYRLNILRLHDESNLGTLVYSNALQTHSFNPAGLLATVRQDGRPILCASCHLSEALPGSGLPGIPPLTEAMHAHHAPVTDPANNLPLDSSANRMACYSCHPGSVTRCLRGAMGKAVAADGSMLMQCQSCHGSMSEVGRSDRTGWLQEPNCQACHVGSATNSYGTIRFSDAFASGVLRPPAENLFATTPHTPMTNISLYRFSSGHGGLQCSACHGSTHAEFPSALLADNMANIEKQGHSGVRSECTSCHNTMPNTRNGGPHGMHRTGSTWIGDHNNAAEALGLNACRPCHGRNGEGSVLSLAFSEKTISTEKGTVHYWKGRKVTCYSCHDGMNSSDRTTRGFPTITNVTGVTTSGVPLMLALSGPNTRIVDQARHGSVALSGTTATYYPDATYHGPDVFTFAANNGYNDSELGTATLTVLPDPAALPSATPADIFSFASARTSLTFASSLAGAYRLQATTNLAGGIWQDVTNAAAWGVSDATTMPVPAGQDWVLHYRVVAVEPPAPPVQATDSATQTVYNSGWSTGLNGGTGFGGWTLVTSNGANAGFFTATTADTNMSMAARAWGLWANSGSSASAFRPLTQPLGVGDALLLRFDNNAVQSGGQVGIGWLNASGQVLAEFFFVGGQATYRVNDRAGSRVTLVPWSKGGWDLSLRVAAPGEYHLTCGDYIVNGLFKNLADQTVATVRIWNANAGSGSANDLYVDGLRQTEP